MNKKQSGAVKEKMNEKEGRGYRGRDKEKYIAKRKRMIEKRKRVQNNEQRRKWGGVKEKINDKVEES